MTSVPIIIVVDIKPNSRNISERKDPSCTHRFEVDKPRVDETIGMIMKEILGLALPISW